MDRAEKIAARLPARELQEIARARREVQDLVLRVDEQRWRRDHLEQLEMQLAPRCRVAFERRRRAQSRLRPGIERGARDDRTRARALLRFERERERSRP